MQIITSNCFWKSCRSKVFHNLISPSNDGIDDDLEFSALLKSCLFSIKNNSQIIAVIDHTVEFSRIKFIVTWDEFYPFRKLWWYFFIAFFPFFSKLFWRIFCFLWFEFLFLLILFFSLLFSSFKIFFCWWFNWSLREIMLFAQLFTNCNKFLFISLNNIKASIIVICIFIRSFCKSRIHLINKWFWLISNKWLVYILYERR